MRRRGCQAPHFQVDLVAYARQMEAIDEQHGQWSRENHRLGAEPKPSLELDELRQSLLRRSGAVGRCPAPRPGDGVPGIPDDLKHIYDEARSSVAVRVFTGAVMLSRKMLMNLAVVEGASEGLSFVAYVEYLANKGFVPPNGKAWVDYIRRRGNEANHEIALMMEADANALLVFVEMLLRFAYEFPGLVPKSDATA